MESETPIEIPLLIVIATLGILVFIFFVILFVIFYQKKSLETKAREEENEKNHQRQLLNTTIEIAELERKKIAANLHDDIGALIHLVKHNIHEITSKNSISEISKLNTQSVKLLENAMDNIRSISREIAPPVLMRLGFDEGLKELCGQITHSGASSVSLENSINTLPLGFQTQIQLYRIIQEILSNIIKHATATKIKVIIKADEKSIVTEIHHNGKGISNQEVDELTIKSKGIGLRSIKNRSEVIGAEINYSKANQHSLVIIKLPNQNEKTD